jgi:hemolysin III
MIFSGASVNAVPSFFDRSNMKWKPDSSQTSGEELANVITHGIGAALGIAGLSTLVVGAARYGDIWRMVSFSIYGATLVILYLASFFYHGARSPRAKRLLQFFDHTAIYLLIAGTYTPFTLVSMRGAWGWTMFGLIWGLAIVGILLNVFFFGRLGVISTILYLLMGWLVVIAIKPVTDALSVRGLAWLVAGGLSYTVGVIFYAWHRLPYAHPIWHLFVLAGSVFHYFAIFFYVLPVR